MYRSMSLSLAFQTPDWRSFWRCAAGSLPEAAQPTLVGCAREAWRVTDDEYLAAIDELASAFHNEQAAHLLLDRIGFPTSQRPLSAPTPRAFWRQVCKEVRSGVTESRV